jgi:hypothetical protein
MANTFQVIPGSGISNYFTLGEPITKVTNTLKLLFPAARYSLKFSDLHPHDNNIVIQIDSIGITLEFDPISQCLLIVS